MLDGPTIINAKKAVEIINENTVAYVVMSIDEKGQASLVTAGDAANMSFLNLSLTSLLHQILEGRDPRHQLPPSMGGLRPVPK